MLGLGLIALLFGIVNDGFKRVFIPDPRLFIYVLFYIFFDDSEMLNSGGPFIVWNATGLISCFNWLLDQPFKGWRFRFFRWLTLKDPYILENPS